MSKEGGETNMTTLARKIATGVALGSTLLTIVSNVAIASDTIEGNGSDSSSTVNNTSNNTTTVSQTNTANVVNSVTSTSNSGFNNASHNTGGNTSVSSGAAVSTANVQTAVNVNAAQIDCNCVTGGNTGSNTISGNGDSSYNKINDTTNNTTVLGQTNTASVTNAVNTSANSGNNKANYNTGGNVDVSSGDAVSVSNVSTKANTNFASLGGGAGAVVAGAGNNTISGNGSDSENKIYDTTNKTVVLGQTNSAVVVNAVTSNADSGFNKANHNTGGNTSVSAGGALAKAMVDTVGNANFANIDCDCLAGAANDNKIKGNGDSSYSKINETDNSVLTVGQGNLGSVINAVSAGANSGSNKANYNTGEVNNPFDPVDVSSSDAVDVTSVGVQMNTNSYGTPFTFPMPTWILGQNASWHFNWTSLTWEMSV